MYVLIVGSPSGAYLKIVIQLKLPQWTFWRKNDGFRGWGWAVFKKKGIILTPFYSNAAQFDRFKRTWFKSNACLVWKWF